MALPDETLHIDTPENIVFDYQVAGLGSRFMAAVVDTILLVLTLLLVNLALWAILDSLGVSLFDTENGWAFALTTLVQFAIFWGFYILFETAWNGQTPGKRWMNLRVIRSDGTPVTLTEVVIRNIIRFVDFLPANYAVGVTAAFIDGQSRRLGDMAAGTLVVIDRRKSLDLQSLDQQVTASGEVPQPMHPQFGPLPIAKLNREDVSLAENYLARKGSLSNPHVLRMQIISHLLRRMDLPQENLDAETVTDKAIMDIVKYWRHINARENKS